VSPAASPVAPDVVAVIGTVTALYAATIAMAQYDIKRILAAVSSRDAKAARQAMRDHLKQVRDDSSASKSEA